MQQVQVKDVSDITPGSHIAFHRGLYHHHAIVEDVDHLAEKVHIIQYGNDTETLTKTNLVTSAPNKAKVGRAILNFTDDVLYKVQHKTCYDAAEIVSRAQSRLGEEAYNVIFSNCEHFANWCMEGRNRSEQVTNAVTTASLGVGILIGLSALINWLLPSDDETGKTRKK